MNRRELLKYSLLSPLLGLFKKEPKEQPLEIVCTEFLDKDGNISASLPGNGNIQTSGNHGLITKRVRWSDGCVFDEKWGPFCTAGTPFREKEELYLSPYLEYNRFINS